MTTNIFCLLFKSLIIMCNILLLLNTHQGYHELGTWEIMTTNWAACLSTQSFLTHFVKSVWANLANLHFHNHTQSVTILWCVLSSFVMCVFGPKYSPYVKAILFNYGTLNYFFFLNKIFHLKLIHNLAKLTCEDLPPCFVQLRWANFQRFHEPSNFCLVGYVRLH